MIEIKIKKSEKLKIKKSGKRLPDEIKDLISTINYDEYLLNKEKQK
jgi:hypothetical protein